MSLPRKSSSTPAGSGWRVTLRKGLSVLVALCGIGLILWLDNGLMDHAGLPELKQNMSHGLLLLVGILTGFHCVGMCGPLVVGYTAHDATAGFRSRWTHAQYAVGKTLSYTLIGALLGAFGSIIAFTPRTQGLIGVAAGLFLLLFGLHMLNAFTALRHFGIRPPAFLMRAVGRQYRKQRSPFVIGLLNGLMILCGPLQAMYVMAAGSGSWAEGARVMFFFGLGTLPMLTGFGVLASLVSANVTPRLLKASGVIVIVLGAIMLNRGMALVGSGWDFNTLIARAATALAPDPATTASCEADQTIRMEVRARQFSPNRFVLRKGVPVKWILDGKELNACNRTLVVPAYDLTFEVREGPQTVSFTPTEAGVISWSCAMGMMPGTFIVVEAPDPAGPPPMGLAGRVRAAWETLAKWLESLQHSAIRAILPWRMPFQGS